MKAGKRLIKDPTGEVLGELSAKDFKARVMENATHEDTASLPMGRVVFDDEGKGQFVVRDVDQMMREGQNIAWSDDELKTMGESSTNLCVALCSKLESNG